MVSVVTAGLSKFVTKGAMILKQTGKRLLAVLLALALCLSLFPVMASAEEAAEPKLITSFEETFEDVNGNYKLAKDITVTSCYGIAFNGTFDGDGHTITINIEGEGDYLAMFTQLGKDAVVKNFVVDSATVLNPNRSYIAAIAGESSGTISDIHVKKLNVSGMTEVGGLVGEQKAGATLTRCSVDEGTITKTASSDASFGGLVGLNAGTVSLCSAGVTLDHSNARAYNDYTGGIVGKNTYYGTITDCYFNGTLTDGSKKSYKIGGICGDASGTIKNCYFSGTLTSTAGTKNPITNTSVTNCYYLDTSFTDSTNYGTKKTAEEFASLAATLGTEWEDGSAGFPVLSWQTWLYSNTAVKYKVETYLENLAGDGYTLSDTAEVKAEPDTTVTAEAKAVEGFTFDTDNENNVLSGKASAELVLKLYYTRNSYTLTWDTGDYAISSAEDAYTHGKVKFGTPIVAPKVAATGMSVKWDKELKTMPAADTKITASYTPAVYDVNWNANGGYFEKDNGWGGTEQVETLKWTNYGSSGGAIYGQTLGKYKWNENSTSFSNRNLPVPAHKSKVFDGWYTAADGGELVTADTVVTEPADGSFTYYAHWTDGWTVTFDPNGGYVNPKTALVKKGAAIGSTNIPTPTRTGHTFDGWYNGKDKLEADTVIDGDVTYTAHWTVNTYKLNFDANRGTGTMPAQEFSYGEKKAISKNLFTREGYRFIGWTSSSYSSTVYYEDEAEYTFNSTYNQTLYAAWEEVKYRLSFELAPADATVVVKNANGSTQSATDGVYNLSEGKYTYTVSAYGYETETGEIDLTEDTVKSVNLTKIPTYTVTFSVTKPEGTGETQITVTDADGKVMTADENGVYNLMAGKYSYLVKAKGATKAKADFTVEDEALTFDITLDVQEGWDGETMTEPHQITAEEAVGEYDGMTGWYRIESGEQLAWFANKVNNVSGYNANAVLAKDIDLGNELWTPMGKDYSYNFTGIFDGNGHTIKNLYCEGTTYQGLFGYNKGTVRNLTVYGDVMLNASSESGSYANAGGISAYQYGGKIENCASYVNVTNEHASGRTGGITGYASSNAAITGCYNAGTLTGGSAAAGIVGYCGDAKITDCYNIGTLIGGDNVTETSYNFAQISGIASSISDYSNPTITNCYNAGEITNTENYSRIGSLVATRGGATLSNCYYLTVDGLKAVGNGLSDGCTVVTAEELASSEMPGKLGEGYKANTGCNNVAPLLTWQAIPEHSFNAVASDVERTPATCTEAATYYVKCDVCGAVSDEEFVTVGKPNGHSFTTKASDQKASDATCTEPAKYYVKCDNCDAVSDTVTVAVGTANGHSFTTKASDKLASAATCTEPAKYYVKCDNCDAVSETETVAVGTANGHTEVIDAAVEPTCTEPGKTAGKHCSVCNEVLVAQQEVPAKGHTEVEDAAVEPTCTEPGKTAGKHCSVCNEVLVAQQEVPAKGHTYENGVCTVCGAKDPDYVAPAWNNPFNDVAEGNWFYEGVKFVHQNGLFNGTAADTFSPNAPMTRGMLVTVLWRLDGKTAPKAACTFTDVDAKAYYADAVAWAAENSIVNGIGENKFDPEGEVTREQIAAILSRYAESKGVDTSKRAELASFPDADKVSAYAKDAMAWAVENGLVNGIKNGSETTLAPQGTATRAQVAAILARYVQNTAE